MAELILSPIAENIIGDLRSAAVKEIALIWGVNDELEDLEETIKTIKAVLLDAEEKQSHNHQVRNWLQRLGGAVDEADILKDEFNTEALRRQLMPGSGMAKQVCTFLSSSNQLAFRHKMGCRIREIKKKLDAISKDKNFCLEVRQEDDQVILRRKETHSYVRQEEVIGRDDDREKIVKLLLEGGESKENVSVIPIVGMAGLGKTTLAQSSFNVETVQRHFELKIWVCVSDNFDLMLIAQQIIKSAANSNNLEAFDSMDELQKRLRKVLNGKRYLLVLDDVWEEKGENWLKLKDLLFSTGSHGSRIVVTTRSKVVAEITGSVQPYQLGILDDEKSWSLFEKMAFRQKEGEINLKIVDIGRQIVQKCGGVPLAIRVIGSLLSFKNLESEWFSFYKGFSGISQQKEDNILPTLKLSYDRLTSHLKRCFAYCRLFPKDYRIKVQRLVKLWMAQGLLKTQDPSDDRCLEDVGYEYFVALLERSFFQEAEIDEFGTIETCKMHDLMHDLAIKVAGTECTIVSLNAGGNIDKDTRHVSFDFNIESLKKISTLLVQASKIRTVLLLGEREYCRREEPEKPTLDAIVSSLKLIHMLDLNHSKIKILPKSIGECMHLRYLDLSYNSEMKMLPNSITSLLNLQTLRLNGCTSLQELPRDLKKLVNLRHLEIDLCHGLTHMPPGLSQLTKLQTLSRYILIKSSSSIKRRGGELKELMGLNKISGKLEILNLRHGNGVAREYGIANLKEKQYIRSLELNWIDDDIIDEVEASAGYKMTLEALRPHLNIQELALGNYGGVKFSSWLSSLTNLVNLSLDSCKKCQHLVPLNQFHRLKKLELKHLPCLEYINGEEDLLLSSATVILPSLRELRLGYLPNLKGWWREVVSRELLPCFPISLFELCIEFCPQLSCMPLYPHLEEELTLVNTRLKPFQQTIEGIPTSSSNNKNNNSLLSPLSKLKSLRLARIDEDLQCLPDWFKSLSSLKSLNIYSCSKLKDLSPGIQHLTSLEDLKIGYCMELEEMTMVNSGSGRQVLRSLSLSDFPKLASLPESIQHLTTLQQLKIASCKSLETIPEWIGNLISLESLCLQSCPELKSLPEGIRSLTCLGDLGIWYCPILLKRCQREIGEDWPKIAHIQRRFLLPDPNHEEEDNDEETRFAKRKPLNIFKKFGLCNNSAGSGTSHV